MNKSYLKLESELYFIFTLYIKAAICNFDLYITSLFETKLKVTLSILDCHKLNRARVRIFLYIYMLNNRFLKMKIIFN